MIKRAAISTIKLYQKTISPDHGVFSGGKQKVCRFHPTCSEYMVDAINKYGVFGGSARGAWRIMRCNPFSKGGFDPVENPEAARRIEPATKSNLKSEPGETLRGTEG